MSKDIKFSEAFKKIHNDSEKIISSHISRLDRLSNDIKSLEHVIVQAGIPFKFEYELKTEVNTWEDVRWHYQLEWDKKRLVYREYKWDGSFTSQPDKKIPLIETKSQLRLSVENELPIFYKMIIEELQKDPLREFVYVKSPNYTRILMPIPF